MARNVGIPKFSNILCFYVSKINWAAIAQAIPLNGEAPNMHACNSWKHYWRSRVCKLLYERTGVVFVISDLVSLFAGGGNIEFILCLCSHDNWNACQFCNSNCVMLVWFDKQNKVLNSRETSCTFSAFALHAWLPGERSVYYPASCPCWLNYAAAGVLLNYERRNV